MVSNISGSNNDFGQKVYVQRDLSNTKSAVKKADELDSAVEKTAAGVFIPLRRLQSVPDKINNGENVAAATALGLAFMTLPEDLRDVRAGYRQAKAFVTGQKYTAPYVTKEFQHDFSWLKGTFFQSLFNKVKSEKGIENVRKLYKADKSLYNTPFGKLIKKALNISDGKSKLSEVKDIFGEKMFVREIKAPNLLAELTGRTMKRITIFGVAALALLELPKLFKATGEGNNFFEQAGNTAKQTVKSGINVASIAAGIGYCGAIGAKHGGAFGSLLGMSIGAVVGATASNKMQGFIS